MANMTCMALNCTSSSRNNEGSRFHHIPSDAKRRTEWIVACKRTDLMDKPPTFFKNKYVCGFHFSQFATPSLHWISSRNSSTQTWESIKFLGTTPDISELPGLKKIEYRTSHTQTEEFFLCANHKLEVKNENETELTEDETEEAEQISKDSEQESEEEMSIDEFLQQNEGLENQIREVLKKNNIPQTPINKKSNSSEDGIGFHKRIQTDRVSIYKIPRNNKCFQQCLRCGKNASRLVQKKLKPDHLFTLKEFETACERFLSPAFCATVKNRIQIEQLLNKLDKKKYPIA